MKRLLCLLLVWGSLLRSAAQEAPPTASVPVEAVPAVFAEFHTSATAFKLGELFTLTLTARVPSAVTLDTWPVLNEAFAPLAVISSEPRTLSQRESETVYEQTFQAVLWGVGSYTTPEARIVYVRNGQRFFAPVQSITLTVTPQIEDLTQAVLRPSFPLVDVEWLPPLLPVALVGVVVLILWLLLRRRPARDRVQPAGRAAALIIAQLNEIQDGHLSTEEAILYAVERLRAYLTAQMQLNATEMTTREIVEGLRTQRLLPKSLVSGLNTLLEQADLIKFANLSPAVNAQQFVRAAIRWVKQADTAITGLYD